MVQGFCGGLKRATFHRVCLGLLKFRYFSYLNLSFRWGMVMGEGDMWGREDVDWGKRGM